ncbi:hypothetical protein QQF64_003070 [Cirrhinus molitorella]|uniref:Uncharacterized protein n=1 Tax=Cirrhinus molitorella TaxID=172907 RepID=A0ABR3MJ29_9TELE
MLVDSYLPGGRPHGEKHLHRLSWPRERRADRFRSHLRELAVRKQDRTGMENEEVDGPGPARANKQSEGQFNEAIIAPLSDFQDTPEKKEPLKFNQQQ